MPRGPRTHAITERQRDWLGGCEAMTNMTATEIADAIYAALGQGLIVGWVGIGEHDKATAFPNNGIPSLPTQNWSDSLLTIPSPP